MLRKKRAMGIYLVLAVLVVLLNIIAWNSTAFCDAYIRYVFPLWVNTYGRLMGIFPFSVGEILIVLGVCSVVVFALFAVGSAIAGIYRLCRGRQYVAGKVFGTFLQDSKGILPMVCLVTFGSVSDYDAKLYDSLPCIYLFTAVFRGRRG